MEYTLFCHISLICIVFALVSLQAVSADDHTNHTATPISCYQCNSADGMEGPTCATGDVSELTPYLKPCPTDSEVYTRCRKMEQNVEGESRIIRSCATAGASAVSEDRCIDRVGTIRVKVKYCECFNKSPQEPCNTANQQISSVSVMGSLILLASLFLSRL